MLRESKNGGEIVKALQRIDYAMDNLPNNPFKENPIKSFLVSRVSSQQLSGELGQLVDKFGPSVPRLYQELSSNLQHFGKIIQLPQEDMFGIEDIEDKFWDYILAVKETAIDGKRAAATANSISILVTKLENQMREMEGLALPFFSHMSVVNNKVKLTRSTVNPLPPSKEINLFSKLNVFYPPFG